MKAEIAEVKAESKAEIASIHGKKAKLTIEGKSSLRELTGALNSKTTGSERGKSQLNPNAKEFKPFSQRIRQLPVGPQLDDDSNQFTALSQSTL